MLFLAYLPYTHWTFDLDLFSPFGIYICCIWWMTDIRSSLRVLGDSFVPKSKDILFFCRSWRHWCHQESFMINDGLPMTNFFFFFPSYRVGLRVGLMKFYSPIHLQQCRLGAVRAVWPAFRVKLWSHRCMPRLSTHPDESTQNFGFIRMAPSFANEPLLASSPPTWSQMDLLLCQPYIQ